MSEFPEKIGPGSRGRGKREYDPRNRRGCGRDGWVRTSGPRTELIHFPLYERMTLK